MSDTPLITRAAHLAWCKERALAHLPHDPGQAIASFASDVRKHPETGDIAYHPLLRRAVMEFTLWDDRARRDFIEGWK